MNDISKLLIYFQSQSILFTTGIGLGIALYLFKTRNEYKNFYRFTLPDLTYEEYVATKSCQNPIRTVLITGGNGFVGRHIIEILLREGNIQIIVLDVILPSSDIRKESVTYVKANLLIVDQLEKIFGSYSIDSVIHCASLIPYLGVPRKAIWLVNVQGTRNLVNVSKKHKVKSFIYTSSATVVLSKDDKNARNLTEDLPYPIRQMDTYTTTKKEAELIMKETSDVNSLLCVCLRPSAIYGKGDKMVSDNIVRGKDAVLIGIPSSMMDWIHVESVANAHVLAEKASHSSKRSIMSGQVYNIGSNEEVSYGEFFGKSLDGTSLWDMPCPTQLPLVLVDVLATLNEVSNMVFGLPLLQGSLNWSSVDYTRRHYTFSSKKAFDHFGYQPLFTVRQGIRRIVDDYKQSIKQNKVE